MGTRVRVVLVAEIHVVVIVFLEQDLGGAAGERDACLERAPLWNLLDALQVSVPGDERERLPGTASRKVATRMSLAGGRAPVSLRSRQRGGAPPSKISSDSDCPASKMHCRSS